MTFRTFFNLTSYAVVICGFLALFVAGGVGAAFAAVFVLMTVIAWKLESTKFQISDRVGTGLVVLAIPLFYLIWKFRVFGIATGTESALAGLLSRFILGLSLIKLFQKKRDRDWLFLYLMAFFEVLLSAALSISPLYVAVLLLYLFVTSVAVISFEIGKSARLVKDSGTNEDPAPEKLNSTPFRRLPATSVLILVGVVAVSTPIFFFLPRVGGAGFGANQNGLTGLTGFSDRVRLGEIGRIQQSDETVMRVRVQPRDRGFDGLRWRGIALDEFDNLSWKQSRNRKMTFIRTERESFLVGARFSKPKLILQTFYLEPMDTPVVFTSPRAILLQGSFSELRKDEDDGLTAYRPGMERATYSVQSDIALPTAETLRDDYGVYTAEEASRYLQLPPTIDPRISELARSVMSGFDNRFDRSRAVEGYLQTQFGYTLEQKASGDQPVADFLFNIREGHCEYFSSAMVLMLRTQGIAARVVNGFQQGEYNETADVFVVKQKDAHSWVEVYFPQERVWVPFDPTPFAGQTNTVAETGFVARLGQYLEAFETFWIQYFVAYDNQEQKSLFKSMSSGFSDLQSSLSGRLDDLQTDLQQWWREVRGDEGVGSSALAIGKAILAIFVVGVSIMAGGILWRKIRTENLFKRLLAMMMRRRTTNVIEFYERMQRALAKRGFIREPWQTPLEFAGSVGISEATAIASQYNRVRFGGQDLTEDELDEIESMLSRLEHPERGAL